MLDCITIHYISPMSNFNFTAANKYYLVITNMRDASSYGMHVIQIDKMQNVDNLTKAYKFNAAVTGFVSPMITFKIYETTSNHHIKLLFSQKMDMNNVESNNKTPIVLYSPNIIPTAITYTNNQSFANELFYNYESYDTTNKCLLFTTKTASAASCNVPFIFSANNMIYDRYSDMFFTEHSVNKTFIPRKITNEPYNNNVIVNPCDGRTKGILTCKNHNMQISLSGKMHNVTEFLPRSILEGSCAMIYNAPNDYKSICFPYDGYITKPFMKIVDGMMMMILELDNPYYMPSTVRSRELISVMLGNAIFQSRIEPEYLNVQNKVGMKYYIIIWGNDVSFTNRKLLDARQLWVDKGDVIGQFGKDGGNVVVASTQTIKFTSEIEGLSEDDILTYVKQKDIIGLFV